MCYYNRLIIPVQQAFDLGDFTLDWPEDIYSDRLLQSGFEYRDWPIIVWSEKKQAPLIVKGHWEFLPPWTRSLKAAEDSRQKYNTLNAVGETLQESRLFKEASLKRRCLVFSSGFYEWRHLKIPGAKKESAFPYFVHLPGQPVFFMAGIWQPFTDKETGEFLVSFAIVTTKANALMEQVHNKKKRMPLILNKDLAVKWVSPGLSAEDIQAICSWQFDPEGMKASTIQKDFRTATNPVASFEYEWLPALY